MELLETLFTQIVLLAKTDHWFLAFCEIWLIGCTVGVAFRLVNRVLRTVKVCVRGWPPSHLDADGDFKIQK